MRFEMIKCLAACLLFLQSPGVLPAVNAFRQTGSILTFKRLSARLALVLILEYQLKDALSEVSKSQKKMTNTDVMKYHRTNYE